MRSFRHAGAATGRGRRLAWPRHAVKPISDPCRLSVVRWATIHARKVRGDALHGIIPNMPGNSFGELFRITTAGVSHGPGYLLIIDGCPPGLPLSVDDLLPDLRRRRPGQSKIVSQRQEEDVPVIWSGVFEGKTDGMPIGILFHNTDQRSQDYGDIKDKYRPGHADFTFDAKYGFRDYRGGGRSSARETLGRVAAGAVAKKLLAQQGIFVLGYVKQIGAVFAVCRPPIPCSKPYAPVTAKSCITINMFIRSAMRA